MCNIFRSSTSGSRTTCRSSPPTKPRRRSRKSRQATAEKYGKDHPGKDGKPLAGLAFAHHIRRRRRSALLVFGHAATPATQLRASHHRGLRQRRHTETDRRTTARPFRQRRRRPRRRPPIADKSRRLSSRTPRHRPRRHQRPRRRKRHRHAPLRSPPRSSESCARVPTSARVRDDWGQDGFEVTLKVDPDRANIAGVTNQDVAQSSSRRPQRHRSHHPPPRRPANPRRLPPPRRGTRQPLRSPAASTSTPLHPTIKSRCSRSPRIENILQTLRIRHLEHFRTISVQSFTRPNVLPSEVFSAAAPTAPSNSRPRFRPATASSVSGEQAKQQQGFNNLAVVMAISIAHDFSGARVPIQARRQAAPRPRRRSLRRRRRA